MLRRMPRIQLCLPKDLYQQVKEHGLPASKIFQEAVREDLYRRGKVAALDDFDQPVPESCRNEPLVAE